MKPDLVTVGGLTVDNIVAADGMVTLDAAGGNGAFSAAGALSWVDRVGLVSCAAASYPAETIASLEAGGVDLAGVVWSDATLTSGSWFLYDAEGRRDEGLTAPSAALAAAGFPTDRLSQHQIKTWREVLVARKPLGEIGYSEFRVHHPLRAQQVPQDWVGVRGVHLAPCTPDVLLEMLDLFRPAGALITADPGWRLIEQALDRISPILARLDAFLPSEVELAALVPGAGPADALSELARHCPGAVMAKLGAAGALVWDRGKEEAVSVPAEKVAAIDPTGAGDSFCGGVLAGLVETGDPIHAARLGTVSAARTVTTSGVAGALPTVRNSAIHFVNEE